MTTEMQRTFAALSREKLELQDRLNEVTHELAAMQEPMLEYFADAGQTKATIDGVTLYIETVIWANAKPGEMAEACAALAAHGFAEFVHPEFSMQTLSAVAREMDRAGEAFPDAILAHLNVAPKVTVRARRS